MGAAVLVNRRTLMILAFAVAAGAIALAAFLTQRAGPLSARRAKLLISMDDGRSTAFGADPSIVKVGDVTAFAGRRDDPFFFDLSAFLGHDVTDPTKTRSFCDSQTNDFFRGRNVSSIVLELPSSM